MHLIDDHISLSSNNEDMCGIWDHADGGDAEEGYGCDFDQHDARLQAVHDDHHADVDVDIDVDVHVDGDLEEDERGPLWSDFSLSRNSFDGMDKLGRGDFDHGTDEDQDEQAVDADADAEMEATETSIDDEYFAIEQAAGASAIDIHFEPPQVHRQHQRQPMEDADMSDSQAHQEQGREARHGGMGGRVATPPHHERPRYNGALPPIVSPEILSPKVVTHLLGSSTIETHGDDGGNGNGNSGSNRLVPFDVMPPISVGSADQKPERCHPAQQIRNQRLGYGNAPQRPHNSQASQFRPLSEETRGADAQPQRQTQKQRQEPSYPLAVTSSATKHDNRDLTRFNLHIEYRKTLQNLAASMRRSEATRNEILRQRKLGNLPRSYPFCEDLVVNPTVLTGMPLHHHAHASMSSSMSSSVSTSGSVSRTSHSGDPSNDGQHHQRRHYHSQNSFHDSYHRHHRPCNGHRHAHSMHGVHAGTAVGIGVADGRQR